MTFRPRRSRSRHSGIGTNLVGIAIRVGYIEAHLSQAGDYPPRKKRSVIQAFGLLAIPLCHVCHSNCWKVQNFFPGHLTSASFVTTSQHSISRLLLPVSQGWQVTCIPCTSGTSGTDLLALKSSDAITGSHGQLIVHCPNNLPLSPLLSH